MRFDRHEPGALRCAVACALVALGCLACSSDVTTEPGQGGSAAGTATGGAGGTGGAPGTGGTAACDGVDQPAVKIVITNNLTEAGYIDWTSTQSGLGLLHPVRYERQVGSQWEPVPFVRPDDACQSACMESNEGSDLCCMSCGGSIPSMRLLNPGESAEITWSGRRYVTDNNWCDCPCHWVCPPEAGHYRVLVDFYETISCGANPCAEPNEHGVIDYASPAGEPTAYGVEFDVLYDQSELPLGIE